MGGKVQIHYLDGSIMETECVAREGDLAVTRALEDECECFWRVTHLPTSGALPWYFEHADDAGAAMRKAVVAVDWSVLLGALAKGQRPPEVEKLKAIYDGYPGFASPVGGALNGEEIASRLAEQAAQS